MSNSTWNTTGDNCPPGNNNPVFILVACLSALSGLVAAFGNAMVLLAIYRTQALQTVSNTLIGSLAAVDLIVGAVQNPMLCYRSIQYSYIEYTGHVPDVFDALEDFLWMQTFLGTTFCLGAISLERYIAVTRVFRYYEIVTHFRCRCVIVGIWIFSVAFSCTRIFTRKEYHPILWLATALIGCCVPLAVTTFSYFHIFKSVRVQTSKIARVSTTSTEIEERKRIETACHRKTAWTISIVIGVFVLFYIPSLIVACLHIFHRDPCVVKVIGTTAWPWATLVGYASSAVNPWIYSMRFSDFRQAFKRAIRCAPA